MKTTFTPVSNKLNDLFSLILDASFLVHSEMGPGLFENVYQECLYLELQNIGLKVEKQKSLPVIYKGHRIEIGYRADLLVENKIIVELKSVEALCDVHIAQILNYMKLSGCRLGLLANFNVKLFKDGYRRMIL